VHICSAPSFSSSQHGNHPFLVPPPWRIRTKYTRWYLSLPFSLCIVPLRSHSWYKLIPARDSTFLFEESIAFLEREPLGEITEHGFFVTSFHSGSWIISGHYEEIFPRGVLSPLFISFVSSGFIISLLSESPFSFFALFNDPWFL